MIDLNFYTWQLRDPKLDGWVFGQMIRGIVRYPVGEVYYDEEGDHPWIWFVNLGKPNYERGAANKLEHAIEAVEKALGECNGND